MKKTLRVLFMLSLLGCSIGVATGTQTPKLDKIVIEQKTKNHIIAKAARDVKMSQIDTTDNVMAIRLNYEDYDDDMYEKITHNKKEESDYKDVSKNYHSGKNNALAEKLGISSDDLFISDYTPFIYYDFKHLSMSEVYDKALDIESNSAVQSIHLFQKDIYQFEVDDLEKVDVASLSNVDLLNQDSGSLPDLRDIPYDNFPNGTSVTGAGIKIGLFDSGILNKSNPNFDNIYIETVYDTYTNAAETSHPTLMASIIAGKYGIASLAQIYYVDANSDTSYTGIERLINKDVDVINMSLGSSSCYVNGEYNVNLEGYIDYIYQSTHTPIIAAAGNTLNLTGTGGYVNLPGLCANVITVGSITTNGTPSVFSSYRMKNDVISKPSIVAVGSSRVIPGFTGAYDGTSMSTAAVTGAVALLLDKRGSLDMPEIMTLLQSTANRAKINTVAQSIQMKVLDVNDLNANGIVDEYIASATAVSVTNNFDARTGFNERTGAGALDIAKLLSNTNTQLTSTLTVPSTAMITLKANLYLNPGAILTAAIAWERSVTVDKAFWWWETTTYTSNTMANYDLYISSAYSNVLYTTCNSSNNEMVRYTVISPGYYSIKLQPRSNYASATGNYLNYSYSVN